MPSRTGGLPLADKGFPKSMLRKVRVQAKCRCGNPIAEGWRFTLSDPLSVKTTSVPLCSSCGPVLFDWLVEAGWLQTPVVGQAKRDHEELHKTKTTKVEARGCSHGPPLPPGARCSLCYD